MLAVMKRPSKQFALSTNLQIIIVRVIKMDYDLNYSKAGNT